MKFLFDTSKIEEAATEIELSDYGQLITPLTGMTNRGYDFAIDNGCFNKFNERNWFRILERERPNILKCHFVTLPDVVGCAARTRALFEHYKKDARLAGYKLAYVLQDGQGEDAIPFDEIAYVFLGGTDDFKLGDDAKDLIEIAKSKGTGVHIGRVNSRERYDYFDSLGCNSCDGSGLARFTWQRNKFAESRLF